MLHPCGQAIFIFRTKLRFFIDWVIFITRKIFSIDFKKTPIALSCFMLLTFKKNP